MRPLVSRLAALFRRSPLDAALDEEVRGHLDLLAAEYERRGLTPDDARHAARRAFGGVEPMKERYRDRRGVSILSDLSRDVTFALRLLVRDRWVTLTATLALALGMAATTFVVTIANTVLYRDLPFTDPDRVVGVGMSVGGSAAANAGLSYQDLLDYRAASRSFTALAAATETTMNVADDDAAPERVPGAYLSANSFDLIGETPVLGRSFTAADDRPGATPVALLGESIWRTRYRSDPATIGRTIRVNGVPSVVIGVMREGLGFPVRSRVWQPIVHLPASVLGDRRARSLAAFGRIAPGISIEQASSELRGIAGGLAQRYGETNAGVEPRLAPYRDRAVGGRFRETLPLMLGIVVSVLLIACANVANLLLARAASRAREVSVRLAMGASRARIVRQMLVESVFLAVSGGLVGLALSLVAARFFWRTLASGSVPPAYWLGFSVDWRVFALFAAICLGTAIVFGTVPALHASRTSISGSLNAAAAGSGGAHRSRWANRFVIAQLALTPILLTTAGLLVRSIAAQEGLDAGVSTAGVARMRVELSGPRYEDASRRSSFYAQLEERLAALPVPATLVSHAPFEEGDARRLASGAAAALPPQERPIVRQVTIGTGYFDTLGAPLHRGRAFTGLDGGSGLAPAIVNERFAALHAPGADPIGQQVTLQAPPAAGLPPRTVEIVGVAPDIRQRSTESARPADAVVYLPYTANPDRDASILVRSNASPGAVASLVREQLRDIDPDLALFDVTSLDESLASSDERLGLRVFGATIGVFAGIGLILATVGVYAVTAYAAAQRTREIGLRVALGALPSQVWWLVTHRAVRQLAVGLAIGLAGSVAIGQLLRGVLIGTSAADPLTFVTVVAVLVVATLVASLIPARRAMRLDPVSALRSE